MGRGGKKRTAIVRSSPGSVPECAIDQHPQGHGVRFRWGTTELVLFSIPLEELAPAPAALDQVAQRLSPAEGAVVELASRGYRNAEIAQRRATAISTTKKQLESAYRKLGVSSRAELMSLLARGQRRAG